VQDTTDHGVDTAGCVVGATPEQLAFVEQVEGKHKVKIPVELVRFVDV
jgi:hypothetical protein